ncbi:adenosylcobinamide-GDP ribazoletransferase [Dyella koreensis]|uniref:Adenosylcobinamide-GDP ribazoletransferase n=1 Tax=Dyella koreensis TaxID=311235 RepID=A0ABW8K5Q7_9GAMM
MMRGLLMAIGFLTRIPVPASVFDEAQGKGRSLAWYPAVGLLIGLLLYLLQWGMQGWSPLLVAALLLSAWVLITGALHLDGLADSADAWIGGIGDRERTLAIMKDPRCGPAGVVALVLVLLVKFAALAGSPMGVWLLLAPLLGRAVLTVAFLTTPYVRSGGLGSGLMDAPALACLSMLAMAVLFCLSAGWRGAWVLVAVAVLFLLWRRACMHRLGGMTGDTCGALAELTEAVVLVVLAAPH